MAPTLYILDLDGTVYRGKEPVSGAAQAIAELRKRGKSIRFVTNNSGATRKWVVEKLAGFEIEAHSDEVMSSGIAAGIFLAEGELRKVFIVGEPGLFESVADAGNELTNSEPDISLSNRQADCVLVGICRSFTYDWLNTAMRQLVGGAQLIATNVDGTYPIEGGNFQPGAGSMLAAIRACTNATPLVIGKPETYMLDLILAETGVPRAETLIVGDRVETDIEWGKRAGCPTHLVLTGVAREAPPGQRYSENLLGLVDE